jgi:hypothetical protein
LHLPEVGCVVAAFWASYLLRGHGAHLMLFSDHCYRFFAASRYFFGVVSGVMFSGFLVSTFLAH